MASISGTSPLPSPESYEKFVCKENYEAAEILYNTEDFQSAVPLLMAGVEHHHPPSMYLLGRCYQEGSGVSQNSNQAVTLFLRAAILGSEVALRTLAASYTDVQRANDLLLEAATQDNSEAMVELGSRSESEDMKKAAEWYQKAAKLDNAEALNRLSDCYDEGKGVPKDREKFISLWHKAADLGDPDAIFAFGDVRLPNPELHPPEVDKYPADEREAYRQYLRAMYKGHKGIEGRSAKELLSFLRNNVHYTTFKTPEGETHPWDRWENLSSGE